MAWVIPDNEETTKYHLYIGGEDGVIANTNLSSIFQGFTNLKTADLSNLNTENVTNISYMFSGCSSLTELDLSNLNTENVTNMNNMFYGCSNLAELNLSNFNTENVTSMNSMFYGCSNLTELDLSNFNTENVTNMGAMFRNMTNINTIYATENFKTTKVTSGVNMFTSDSKIMGGYGTKYSSSKVTHTMAKIDKTGQQGYFTDKNNNIIFSPIIKAWTSTETTDFHNSTYKQNIISVEILDNKNVPGNAVASWDVSKYGKKTVMAWVIPDNEDSTKYHLYIGGEGGVIANDDSSNLFFNFTNLKTADFSKLNTENVTNMSYMFRGCSNLTELDLSNFNTENVTNMSNMFSSCSNLKTIYASENFTISKITYGSDMFKNDGKLVGGYGTVYSSSNYSYTMAKIDEINQSGYFTNKNDNLIDKPVIKSWATSNTTDFHNSTYKSNIISVEILDNKNVPTSATESWDVSVWENETVKAWVIPDTNDSTKYHLYIGGEDGVIANPNSSRLFNSFTNLKTADLSNFNTEYVTNMGSMFSYCSSLTKLDLSNFNTENVTDMYTMFESCSNLTELNVSSFNTSNVTNMSRMFAECTNLTILDLSNFNTPILSSVYNMFNNMPKLKTIYASDNFTTSSVTTVTNMFTGDTNLVGGYSTTYQANKTTNTMAKIDKEGQEGYFTDKSNNIMNKPIIKSWSSSATTDFHSSTYKSNIISTEIVNNINIPVNATESWDVSVWENETVKAWVIPDTNNSTKYHLYIGGEDGVIGNANSSNLFYNFTSLKTVDLSNLNTENVTNMSYMFYGCSSLTELNLSNINTSNVTNMSYMFENCSSLTELDLSDFNTESVTSMSYMFYGCSSLTELNLSSFNTENVTNMSKMFHGCRSLAELDLSNFNTTKVISMDDMFSSCSNLTNLDLSNFNTEKVKYMDSMFSSCSNLTNLDLSNFNTEKVISMDSMFTSCSNLTNLDLSNFNTEKVTNMKSMFAGCSNLTELDLSNFNTENVTNMRNMFSSCSNLTNLDLSNFNTENVTNMYGMFYGCSNLTELDLSNFNTSNVTNMESMFQSCSKLTELDLSSFNTAKVTNMHLMFWYCSKLTELDLSNFNTENVTNMESMFKKCTDLKTIYASENFITSSVTSGISMFTDDTNLVGGNGTVYDSTKTTHTMAKIDKNGQEGYFTNYIKQIKVTTTKTSNSITVVAAPQAAYTDIIRYEFSNDGGTTFIDEGSNNTHRFENLTNNTPYQIVVRITSQGGNIYTTDVKTITTRNISAPTYKQTNNAVNDIDVTITFPKECESTLTCTYQKNNETPVTVTSKTQIVKFTSNGELTATVTDGTNTVSSAYTVVT